MAKSPEQRRLEDVRETKKMMLRTLRSDITNPQRLLNEVKADEAEIKRLAERISRTKARFHSMHEQHDSVLAELSAINAAIKLEANAAKIKAIKDLANRLFDAENPNERD